MNEDKLHQIARDIMERLNEKYNITNELSLDEYLDEFRGMLIEAEIDEAYRLEQLAKAEYEAKLAAQQRAREEVERRRQEEYDG